jgi:hypothetical protein
MNSAASAAETRAKTRSLRKYESPPVWRAGDAERPSLDLMTPFGPMIGRTEAPAEIVDGVNRYCEGQIKPGVGAEFLLPRDVVFGPPEASLGGWIESQIRRYVAAVDAAPCGRITIDVAWIVSQYAGSPSPVHFHTGDISGVLYLRTPQIQNEADEEQKTYISGRQAGHLNFLIGGKQKFAKSLVSFKPRVGDFFVFPGWLLHGAEPFRGSGERRSLAFNAFVEDAVA